MELNPIHVISIELPKEEEQSTNKPKTIGKSLPSGNLGKKSSELELVKTVKKDSNKPSRGFGAALPSGNLGNKSKPAQQQEEQPKKLVVSSDNGNVDASVDTDTQEAKSGRFYLPVLFINDSTQWPSQPLENRKKMTDELNTSTCVGNCCGVKGLKSGCCTVDPEDIEHVLGPLDEKWIKDTLKWFVSKGIYFKRDDLVIDYEEGKILGNTFFNGHPVFQSKDSYPIMRMQPTGPRFACKFLSVDTGRCTIYHQRPEMCRTYFCEYVKANFLLRTKDHPNRYIKVR